MQPPALYTSRGDSNSRQDGCGAAPPANAAAAGCWDHDVRMNSRLMSEWTACELFGMHRAGDMPFGVTQLQCAEHLLCRSSCGSGICKMLKCEPQDQDLDPVSNCEKPIGTKSSFQSARLLVGSIRAYWEI